MVKRTIGVVGCGTMGAGIAIVAARAGFNTLIYDLHAESLDRARKQTEAFLAKSVERGKLAPEKMPEILASWQSTQEMGALSDCDLVIEAVFEDLQVKLDLFGKLNDICMPHTILASNTSTISISEIAGGSGRPERFVGMHFCLPAQLMKLVEMSRGMRTSDETWTTAWAICKELGQFPVETKDTPGFILNYFLIPFNNDAIRLVEQGVAEPSEIDKAVKTAMGYPLGPLELLDLVGMDTQKLLCAAMYELTREPRAACPPLVRRMIAAGFLGKKTGRGFHQYNDAKMFGA
jgi:3-hydroxybutyryl-CoA dehydrogenase